MKVGRGDINDPTTRGPRKNNAKNSQGLFFATGRVINQIAHRRRNPVFVRAYVHMELNNTKDVTQLPMDDARPWAVVYSGVIIKAAITMMLGQEVETNSHKNIVPINIPAICISSSTSPFGAGKKRKKKIMTTPMIVNSVSLLNLPLLLIMHPP